MTSVFTIIGSVWQFYRKQPVLNTVMAWLLILPLTLHGVLVDTSFIETALRQSLQLNQKASEIIILLLTVGLSLWVLWGQASVMVIGKRLLQSKAGQSRSSFKTVRNESSAVLIPLFLTEILRACGTLLLSIPALLLITLSNTYAAPLSAAKPLMVVTTLVLLVPPLIFQLRTYFYDIIIVNEDIGYQKALKRSSWIISGNSWPFTGQLVGVYACLFVPAALLSIIIERFTVVMVPMLMPVSQFIGSCLLAFSILLTTLASIVMFSNFKKA